MPVGDYPLAAAADTETGDVYVANTFDDSISVIDGGSGEVTATVPTGTHQPWDLAVSGKDSRVYVASSGSSNIRVIDVKAGR